MIVILFLISLNVIADGWTNQPSHATLYADTITSKADSSSVNIADAQGLFVTGDITTLGKVGVGTTSLSSEFKLHISDGTQPNLLIERTGSLVNGNHIGFISFKNGADAYGEILSRVVDATTKKGDLLFYTGSGGSVSEKVRITNTGNVGIGTTGPVQKLTIEGTNTGTAIASGGVQAVITNTDTTVNNIAALVFGQGVGSANSFSRIGVINADRTANSEDQHLFFATIGAGSFGERMRITSSGNVGIGTAVPDQKLDVHGIALFNNGGSPAANGGLRIVAPIASTHYNWMIGAQENVGAALEITPSTVVGGTAFSIPVAVFTQSGNVGIGTTGPEQKLEVAGAVKVTTSAAVDTGSAGFFDYASGGARIMSKGADATTRGIFVLRAMESDEGNALNVIETQADGDVILAGSGTGNVGIGTTSPGYKLDVAGDAHATSFPTSSDIRLKKNISQITSTLDKLQNIHGVRFEWNDKYEQLGRATNGTQIGIIAQELEKEFPELVTTWGNESYKAIDYGRFSAVLLEAVKELKDEIELLNVENTDKDIEIQQLKAKNEQLTIEIAEIKSKLNKN